MVRLNHTEAKNVNTSAGKRGAGLRPYAAQVALCVLRISELTLFIGFTAPYWTTFTANKLTTRQAESGLLRMMAPAWWYTKIKRARDVQREHMAIAVGQVQKAASAYVSRGALNEWTEQKRRNAEFFKKFDLMNQDGDRVSMADMVYGSVSNPAVRRCELMVRMRGFEDIANETGMAGEFYTITAPSRYHSVHSKGGFVSQWNGCKPNVRISSALAHFFFVFWLAFEGISELIKRLRHPAGHLRSKLLDLPAVKGRQTRQRLTERQIAFICAHTIAC